MSWFLSRSWFGAIGGQLGIPSYPHPLPEGAVSFHTKATFRNIPSTTLSVVHLGSI